jgi:hypothetical protein
VVVSKKNEWVAARESIVTTFHLDHKKMMQVMKAGFPKPVLDRMNEDIKVTESISLSTVSCCFPYYPSISFRHIVATPRATMCMLSWCCYAT